MTSPKRATSGDGGPDRHHHCMNISAFASRVGRRVARDLVDDPPVRVLPRRRCAGDPPRSACSSVSTPSSAPSARWIAIQSAWWYASSIRCHSSWAVMPSMLEHGGGTSERRRRPGLRSIQAPVACVRSRRRAGTTSSGTPCRRSGTSRPRAGRSRGRSLPSRTRCGGSPPGSGAARRSRCRGSPRSLRGSRRAGSACARSPAAATQGGTRPHRSASVGYRPAAPIPSRGSRPRARGRTRSRRAAGRLRRAGRSPAGGAVRRCRAGVEPRRGGNGSRSPPEYPLARATRRVSSSTVSTTTDDVPA